jgi:DNA-binding transcriptional ArsR family regulator
MTAQTLPHLPQRGQKPFTLLSGWDAVRLISWLTAGLVAILALFAFILSYSSLQHMAAHNGLPGWLSYLWPLLLDFAMLVFSLAILRANLRQERAIYPWALTIAFAGLATIANILDVTSLGLPPVLVAASVKALAPIALVLAFELLMTMMRAEVKRSAVLRSLADLTTERETKRAKLAQHQAELDTALTDKQAALDKVLKQIEQAHTRLAELKVQLKQPTTIQSDSIVRAKQIQLEQAASTIAERRTVMVQILHSEGDIGPSALAERLNISRGTVYNDLSALAEAGLIEKDESGWQVLTPQLPQVMVANGYTNGGGAA